MPVFISLLRGINVGGHKKIKMAELGAVYEALGLASVQTVLQSGNVVFTGKIEDSRSLARQIEDGIEARFGFHSDVIIRTVGQFREMIDQNPFLGRDPFDPGKMVVMFLADVPETQAIDGLVQAHNGPEDIQFAGEEVYLYYLNGIGRSKLSNVFIEKKLGVLGTGRNWNTVTRLMALAESLNPK